MIRRRCPRQVQGQDEKHPADMPQGPVTRLPVVLTPVLGLDHGAEENERGIGEIDPVLAKVMGPLRLAPLDPPLLWDTDVYTSSSLRTHHPIPGRAT